MIQRVYEKSDVFAHVTVNIIWFLQQFRCLVDQIGGEKPVKQALLVCQIEFLQPIGKQSECGADEDFSRLLVL